MESNHPNFRNRFTVCPATPTDYNGNKKPSPKTSKSYQKDFRKHQDELKLQTISLKQKDVDNIHKKMIDNDGWSKEEIHQFK